MNRIKEIRENRGLSQTELAEKCDTSLRMIQYLEKGQRQLTQKWLNKIALSLQTSPADILSAPETLTKTPTPQGLKVVGEVKAGTWLEAYAYDPDEAETIPFFDAEYPESYALKVVGDSMNVFYPDGSYVIVTPLYNQTLKNGDHVIVERKKKDGIFEATIKEILIEGKKARLLPRSTNPAHQKEISILYPYTTGQKLDIETITITGIVIASYIKRKR